MVLDRLSRTALIASGLAAFGFVGAYIHALRSLNSSETMSGKAIGTVLDSSQDVRRMPRGRLLWIPLSSSIAVYERDTVKTGPNSRVRIQLDTGPDSPPAELELREDSLVVLETQNKKIQVRLASGDLALQGAVSAVIGGQEVVASGGKVQIKRETTSQDEIEIRAEGGAATLSRADGEQVVVQSGEVATTSSQSAVQVDRFFYSPTSPAHGTLLRVTPDEKISFEWASLSTETTDSPTRIELVVHRHTKTKKHTAQTLALPASSSRSDIDLPPGSYSWQLLNPETGRALTPTTEFRIEAEAPFAWLPERKASSIGEPLSRLQFDWDSAGLRISGRLSVPSTTSKTQIDLVKKTGESVAQFEFLGSSEILLSSLRDKISGVIESTISSESSDGLELRASRFIAGASSATAVLSVPVEIVDARLLSPVTNLTLATKERGDGRTLVLRWQDHPRATSFEVRMGSQTQQTEGTSVDIDAIALAKDANLRFIEVRPMRQAKSGPWTPVEVSSEILRQLRKVSWLPQAIFPLADSTVLLRPGQTMGLEWSDIPQEFKDGTKLRYRIEWRAEGTREETEASVEDLSGTRLDLKLKPGVYSWSVRAVWPDGTRSEASPKQTFVVTAGAQLEAPTFRAPAEE